MLGVVSGNLGLVLTLKSNATQLPYLAQTLSLASFAWIHIMWLEALSLLLYVAGG